jgi:hypothetical protein
MKLKKRMLSETGHDRYPEETLKDHRCDVLENMETNNELL